MKTESTTDTPFITTYYRGGNLCIRRVGAVDTVEVMIPENGKQLPLSHQTSTYPSKERLDQYLATMDLVTQEKYEEYLREFYKAAERNYDLYKELILKRDKAVPAGQ